MVFNSPTTISEGPFVPEYALHTLQYSKQKQKNWRAKCLGVSFVFKV